MPQPVTDNLKIEFYKAEYPERILTIIHGFGEHTQRYQYVIDWFQKHGTSVVIGDLPGHGHSSGMRGHIEDFQAYEAAACSFHESAREQFGTALPHFVLGHSMGGLIAALAAPRLQKEYHIHGLLLSSPCFGVAVAVPSWRIAMGRVLVRMAPKLQQPNYIAPNLVTRNKEIAEQYKADPKIVKTVTLQWYFAFRAAMERALREASAVTLPVAVWQAGADKIVSPALSKQWEQQCMSTDKQYKEIPGLYHELLNEPERDDILSDMLSWMTARK